MNLAPARRRLAWIIPLISTAIFYLIISSFSSGWFAQWLNPVAEPLDFAVQLLIGYALFCVSRRVWAFLIVQMLFMAILYGGNAVMIRFFQTPLKPSDIQSLDALVKVLPPAELALLAVPFAVMVGLFLWNLRFRLAGWMAFCVLLGIPAAIIVLYPAAYVSLVDGYRSIDYQSWDQLQDYLNRGPIVYFTETAVRDALASSDPPTKAAVLAALKNVPVDLSSAIASGEAQPRKRNVHVVLVESFWDPGALSAAKLSRDPWPKALEALWARTGYSRALSPVFGHLTANAEYEMLCGVPALTEGVVFVSEISRPLPCLPRFFAQHGYTTVVQHPNMMNFWNRVSAYRYLGFQRYYSKKDFDLTEMDGSYLSDKALFEQAPKHVRQLAGEKPVFTYIMTLAGHFPYKLNPDLHPAVISAGYRRGFVKAEVNSIHYTAKALLGYIHHLQEVDPSGIIVVAGDHLPSYGTSLDVYKKSGLFPEDVAKATPAQLENKLGTPLIVINGRQGPVNLGAIPMYEVSAHILKMLGYHTPTPFDLFHARDGLHMRPYGGLTLVVNEHGPSKVCHEGETGHLCQVAAAWNRRTQLLSADLLAGGQYALKQILGADYSLREPAVDFAYIPSSEAKPCVVEVVSWGPKWTKEGRKFNEQPSGDSAFWVHIKKASADVKLRLDGQVLSTSRGPGLLTAGVRDFDGLDDPGKYSLDAVCRYSPGVAHIGTFVVKNTGLF